MTHSIENETEDPLLAYVPAATRRVLDCAPGTGERARRIKDRGNVEVLCIAKNEPEKQLFDFADQVVTGDFQSLDFSLPANYFDCILCDDILPHLRDPLPFLKHLAPTLTPSGLLILTTPNLQFYQHVCDLAEGRWEHRGDGALKTDYLRFFTGAEVIKVLQQCHLLPRGCATLEGVGAEDIPLDEEGYFHCGRVSIGPLNEEEYKAYRTKRYVFLATKP